MTRPTPPTDPAAYALVQWPGYRATLRGHWAWPLTRYVWRTLCGQTQAGCIPAGDGPTCAVCAARLAKIRAKHDADHTTLAGTGVESR
jgi:hypothetical protein